jgi:hypothetical protein
MDDPRSVITASSQFEAELKKLIEAEIETLKENMIAGSYPAPEQYHRNVGIVWAYRNVLGGLADEANKVINEK